MIDHIQIDCERPTTVYETLLHDDHREPFRRLCSEVRYRFIASSTMRCGDSGWDKPSDFDATTEAALEEMINSALVLCEMNTELLHHMSKAWDGMLGQLDFASECDLTDTESTRRFFVERCYNLNDTETDASLIDNLVFKSVFRDGTEIAAIQSRDGIDIPDVAARTLWHERVATLIAGMVATIMHRYVEGSTEISD